MNAIRKLKRSGIVLGSLGAAVVLSLTACDRSSNSGGTADDSLERARDHVREAGKDVGDAVRNNPVVGTNDTTVDRNLDATRDATRDATKDIGRGLERTGQEIQDASRNAATNR